MYDTILVPLENSPTDETILTHVRALARLCGSRLMLLHVADGFVARNQAQLNLADSEEMKTDQEYLSRRVEELLREGFEARSELRCGDPGEEILQVARSARCDLIAMATHGHGLLGDLFLGSVAEKVRHRTDVPVLMVRSPR